MLAEQIVELLRKSEALTALIGERINPFSIDGFTNGIVYSLTPLTDNNIVRTDRLEIHIIADDLETATAIDQQVRKVLLTTGEEPLTDNILKSQINGGGSLEDAATGTKHIITYYSLVSKGGLINGY